MVDVNGGRGGGVHGVLMETGDAYLRHSPQPRHDLGCVRHHGASSRRIDIEAAHLQAEWASVGCEIKEARGWWVRRVRADRCECFFVGAEDRRLYRAQPARRSLARRRGGDGAAIATAAVAHAAAAAAHGRCPTLDPPGAGTTLKRDDVTRLPGGSNDGVERVLGRVDERRVELKLDKPAGRRQRRQRDVHDLRRQRHGEQQALATFGARRGDDAHLVPARQEEADER